jgi:DNA-binding MltR family transcriptional regulator
MPTPFDGDTPRDKIARIIYGANVDRAKDNLGKLEFDPDEFERLFRRLALESDTGLVLIFSSYLEEKISEFISYRLIDISSKTKRDRLFSGGGPLSNFSDKITLAYHLGWLKAEQRTKLDYLRKLRNSFAHNAFNLSINDEEIQSALEEMRYDLRKIVPQNSDTEITKRLFGRGEDKSKELLANLAILAFMSLKDLLLLPESIANQVSPADIVDPFDSAPLVYQNLKCH